MIYFENSFFVPVQILGQHINDFTLPDVNLIGEHSDASELGRMLQLILGCAVNCEQKQGAYLILCVCLSTCVWYVIWYWKTRFLWYNWLRGSHHFVLFLLRSLEYIQTIMMMEESVQHVVMTAIQEVNHHAYYNNWLMMRIRWDLSDAGLRGGIWDGTSAGSDGNPVGVGWLSWLPRCNKCWHCTLNFFQPLTHVFVFLQLMSKETPVMGGTDSYVDLDRQVWRLYRTSLLCLLIHVCFLTVPSMRVSNFRRQI